MKINWDKVNTEKITEDKMNFLYGEHSLAPGEVLGYIGDSLKEAAFRTNPCKTIKLQGPRFRASLAVKDLLKECRKTHSKWKENGSPGPGTEFYAKRKEAKQNLRRQLRRENYLKNEKFYCGLTENPDTFFKTLIKTNQSNRSDSATYFSVNGKSILDTVTQEWHWKIIMKI